MSLNICTSQHGTGNVRGCDQSEISPPGSDIVSVQGSCNDDWNTVLSRIFEKSHRPDACLTSNLCSRRADETARFDDCMTGKHSQPFFRDMVRTIPNDS